MLVQMTKVLTTHAIMIVSGRLYSNMFTPVLRIEATAVPIRVQAKAKTLESSIMDPLWSLINEAIHRKDSKAVNSLIVKYLKAHRSSLEARYEASEFFRKNADYSSALRILSKESIPTIESKNSEIATKVELQAARILNILGASHYALRMIQRIREEGRATSKVEMVEIYHCNYRYSDVIDLIGKNYQLPGSEPWHQDWLLHFYYACALSALGQRDLAIKHVDGIRSLTASPLIRAIALGFKGQFLVQDDKSDKGLPFLLEARRFFLEKDLSFDHANLQKWVGICFLKLGRPQEAVQALRKSFEIAYQPALKPEDWMEVVLWLDRIPGARDPSQRLAPRLFALGGVDHAPLAEVGIVEKMGESAIFSSDKIESTRKTKHIDRLSDTAWNGERARLGLDLIDELVWNLIYVGVYGLPQFRIYELLWPDEPFSFHQHQKRLERLVGRARLRGYEIAWKDLHLRLVSKDVTTSSRPESVIRGYSFLLEHSVFTRRDVEKYFAMSNSAAKALCRDWLTNGLTVSLDRSRYRATIF
jgi:tetratricopeptide (TPR) repeat protein